MKKIITIFTLVVILLLSFSSFVCADFDPVKNPEKFDPKAETSIQNRVKDVTGVALGFLQNLGIIVGVVSLTLIGLKFIIGSAEEKANYKESLLPFVIGAIMVMTIPTILNIIYGFVHK